MLHHDLKELDDDLGGRPAHDLAEATLLSVADALKGIVENTNAHHCCCREKRRTRSAWIEVVGREKLLESHREQTKRR